MSQNTSANSGPRKRLRLDAHGTLAAANASPSDEVITDALSIKRALARVDELEGKCALLETKCRTLESTLEQQQQQQQQPISSLAQGIISSITTHIDNKFRTLESSINSKLQDLDHSSRWLESLHKNREWKYNAPTIPISYWTARGFDEEYVESADSFLEDIETVTCAMRRGECADSYIHLGFGERFDEIDNDILVYDDVMQSHWTEFLDALGQYHWFLNRSSTGHDDSTLIVSDVQIPSELCYMLERVLPLNHFKRLTFQNNRFGRFGISVVLKCVEKNPKLVEVILSENEIESADDAQRLCQLVSSHPSLEILSIKRSCQAFCYDILRSVMHDNCKLECIDVPGNGIRTQGCRHVANFLAKNPALKELTLENNHFDDDDAEAIAEALKTNSNLKCLILRGNDITDRGIDALRQSITDPSSLNLAAACNHSCQIYLTNHPECASINDYPDPKTTRGDKLYNILSTQRVAANVLSLGKNVNLPVAFESIQKYAKSSAKKRNSQEPVVSALSIIYDIMRNKAPELYNAHQEVRPTTDVADDIIPCVSMNESFM